jgi:hypothetical protein
MLEGRTSFCEQKEPKKLYEFSACGGKTSKRLN